MNVFFSDFFQIDQALLNEYGAFNISLINDLPLFIDPFLLFNSEKEQYQILHKRMIDYLKFLKKVSIEREILDDGILHAWFFFPEVRQNWLGYSQNGNGGRGLGVDFALSLSKNLKTVFSDFGDEDITKGSHLEKFTLIKEGVGKDSISDFTTNLIKGFLLKFTENFAVNHINDKFLRSKVIEKVMFNYSTETWMSQKFVLPYIFGDYVILTPKDILTKDSTWVNSDDLTMEFYEVVESMPNFQIRSQINNYLYKVLPENPSRTEEKEVIRKVIEKYPVILDYYLRLKEDNGDQAIPISDERVRAVEQIFINNASALIEELQQETNFYKYKGTTRHEAKQRIEYLKHVVEDMGGYRIFYVNGQPLKRENDIQILFKLTWCASFSELNSEVNDGMGPVDFKITKDRSDKTLVEFKLASNTQLKRNLQNQVNIYKRSSNAKESFTVILYFSEEEYRKIIRIFNDLNLHGDDSIILIDARKDNKVSASKA